MINVRKRYVLKSVNALYDVLIKTEETTTTR